jgi:hypothetical protein
VMSDKSWCVCAMLEGAWEYENNEVCRPIRGHKESSFFTPFRRHCYIPECIRYSPLPGIVKRNFFPVVTIFSSPSIPSIDTASHGYPFQMKYLWDLNRREVCGKQARGESSELSNSLFGLSYIVSLVVR